MPNLFQSLLSGVSNVASRAGDRLMPAPTPGLFNDQDLDAAKRSGLLHLGLSLLGDTSGMGLGPALKQGVNDAQSAYSGTLNDRFAQNATLRQQQILAARDAITKKYAPGPNEDAASMIKKFPLMYADLMRAGDMEGAKNLQGVVERMAELQSKPTPMQAIQLGDRVVTMNPETGKFYDAQGREVTDLTRHMNPDEIKEFNAKLDLMRAQAEQARALKEQTLNQGAGLAFMRQNKPLVDTEQLYQNWDAAYRDAKAGNPAAYKSALANFAAMTDPKVQLRLGTLNFVSKVDPSLVGQAQLAIQKAKDGTFPLRILEEMNRHAQEIHRGVLKTYTSRRDARLKANPGLEPYIDAPEDIFPSARDLNATATSPTGNTSRVQQFLNGFRGK